MRLACLILLCAVQAFGQAQIYGSANLGSVDNSAATSTMPIKVGTIAQLPASCAVGELYFASNATAALNIYGCTATNTWTVMSLSTPVAFASGGTGTASASQHVVIVSSGSAWLLKVLPDCGNGTTDKLLYTQSTQAFTCGTDQGGGSGLTDPTNTEGDIIVRDSSSVTRLAVGSAGTALVSDGTNPSWGTLGTAGVDAILRTRLLTFVLGADNGSALADTDDQPTIWANRLGQGVHITEIWCESDAGTPSINIQKDDGSAASILASNLTCTTSGASSTTFTSGEDAVASTDKLDFLMVTAGGTAKRLTVTVKYTLD